MDKFLDNNPVFTFSDIYEYFKDKNTKETVRQKVKMLLKKNQIKKIKAGLYYNVPKGKDYVGYQPDYYLVASKLDPGAILAYHSALELHGFAHSNFQTIYYQSKYYHKLVRLGSMEFRSIDLQKRKKVLEDIYTLGVEKVDRQGVKINVTSIERTFVDCLDRISYCGGWEELWNSYLKVYMFDYDMMLRYLKFLNKKILFSRAGYFLSRRADELYFSKNIKKIFKQFIPKRPIYFDINSKDNVNILNKEWNILIPEIINEMTLSTHV